jgi:hypothetical protein
MWRTRNTAVRNVHHRRRSYADYQPVISWRNSDGKLRLERRVKVVVGEVREIGPLRPNLSCHGDRLCKAQV